MPKVKTKKGIKKFPYTKEGKREAYLARMKERAKTT